MDKGAENNARKVFSGFVSRLRDDKRMERLVYALLLGTALVIFLATGGISCEGEKKQERAEPAAAEKKDGETELEARLCAILSGIDGAGKVEVMITFDSGPELVTAEERHVKSGGDGSSADSKPVLVSGTGAQEPIVLKTVEPMIRGVIVVAEGASDIAVRVALERAVITVLGADPERVSVFPMGHKAGR